jgi:hypothetical protein
MIKKYNLLDVGIIPQECNEENKYDQMFVSKLSEGKVITIDDEIPFEDFKSALDTWNNKTTTSPSARHLGHYKLMTRLNGFDKVDIKFSGNKIHNNTLVIFHVNIFIQSYTYFFLDFLNYFPNKYCVSLL